jgi:hypothetical protein
MTFILTGRKAEVPIGRNTRATMPVLRVLRRIEAGITTPVATVENDHLHEPEMTSEEAAELRCEGRIAAFQSRPVQSCPYNMASRARRDAWLEGYNTVK